MKNILIKFAEGTNRIDPIGDDDLTGTQLTDSIVNVINIVLGFLGFIAVVIVIIGGIGYMTSQGDPGKVKKAKDTILYGMIGLIICALAFAIVNFVIVQIINKA